MESLRGDGGVSGKARRTYVKETFVTALLLM